MGMLKEFKEFAMKGNVVDLAVAVVIGAAFGLIIKSFVADILMPPIGLLLGNVDFSDLQFVLQKATEEGVEDVAIKYGAFINTVVNFIIVAFSIFLVIKAMNSAKKKEEEAPAPPPAPSKEEQLLMEIRDALVKK